MKREAPWDLSRQSERIGEVRNQEKVDRVTVQRKAKRVE